jgi:hypothetical protein
MNTGISRVPEANNIKIYPLILAHNHRTKREKKMQSFILIFFPLSFPGIDSGQTHRSALFYSVSPLNLQ